MAEAKIVDPKGAFKPKDMEFLTAAFLCLKDPPVIDFERLAPRLNYGNVKSAQNYWRDLQKRMQEMSLKDGDESSSSSSAAVPAPAKKRGGGRGKKGTAATAVRAPPPTKNDKGELSDKGDTDATTESTDVLTPSTPEASGKEGQNSSPRKRKAASATEGELAKAPRRTRKTSNGSNASPRKKAAAAEKKGCPTETSDINPDAVAVSNEDTTAMTDQTVTTVEKDGEADMEEKEKQVGVDMQF